MSIINFQEANCKNCYRCIRSCPVKAIRFNNNQARIMEEACIFCCNCLKECPQNAKTVQSDLDQVTELLRDGHRVIGSLAPSFAGYFEYPEEAKERLLSAGFAEVRETAEAAEQVSRMYRQLFEERGSLMTSACPVVVEYVEKYFPSLIELMADVDSPMMAHAKWLKQVYPDAKVVFIGPCYAKKKELLDQPGWVDAVLTFEDLYELCPDYSHSSVTASLSLEDSPSTLEAACTAQLYPIEGGVIETTFAGSNPSMRHRTVSGIDNCRRLFQSLDRPPEGYFLELNACEGGCINGPVSGSRFHLLEKQDRIADRMRRHRPDEPLPDPSTDAMKRTFTDRSLPPAHYTDRQIQSVLDRTGKYSKETELNCGACGYGSCREKAVAVLDGKAELYMCMPYMQAQAESFAHVVLEKTPNAVIAVSDQLLVLEANDAAAEFFQLEKKYLTGLPIAFLLDAEEVRLSEHEAVRKTVHFPDLKKTAIVSVSYVPEQHLYLTILHDLTERQHEQEKLQALKKETVEMAQKVIENQMRVAQEIASLLGETTAETKVTLTKLKKLLLEE